jgi:hypothetical protein
MKKIGEALATTDQAQKAKIILCLSILSEICSYSRIIRPEYFGVISAVKIALDLPKEFLKNSLFI